MSERDIYVLVLCLVVFALFVGVFTFLVVSLVKSKLQIIKAGLDDERIITEYEKEKQKDQKSELIYKIFSIVMAGIFCVIFGFAIFVNVTETGYANGLPSIKVVKSGSMSYKNSKNTYLKTHNLNDQFDMFDLVVTRKLPDEFDLKLYDVVVYQHENGEMVIHRIVGIEEPNEKHPNKRHFKLQGDAVQFADTYPVLYEQMRGIYKGERVPFVGSFIIFMQSPAGYLCILLVLIGIVLIPIVEKTFAKAEKKRLESVMATSQTENGVYQAQVVGFLVKRIQQQLEKNGGRTDKPVAKLIIDEKSYSIFATKPKDGEKLEADESHHDLPLRVAIKPKRTHANAQDVNNGEGDK